MSAFDYTNPMVHPTTELLQHLLRDGLTAEEHLAIVNELKVRNEDREKFHTDVQAANTKLTFENRALREFMANRQPEWVADVVIETARAKRKHGDNNYTDFESLAILVEEVGEVAQVLNRLYVPPIGAGMNVPREMLNLRDELVQVVSVATRWVERIDLVVATGAAIAGLETHNGAETQSRGGSRPATTITNAEA